jgi:hypothetical protein
MWAVFPTDAVAEELLMTNGQTEQIEVPNDQQTAETSDDQLVTISRWELETLRKQAALALTESSPDLDLDAPSHPEIERRPVAADQRSKLDVTSSRTAELERAYKGAIRDRELATTLANHPLLPGAVGQLIKLLRDDFDVIDDDGTLRVVSRDGRSVTKAIDEKLDESEFAHFQPAVSRGGTAARGAGRTTGQDRGSYPRNLGEAALQRWRESALERTDPSTRPIGLRRR